MSKKKCYTKQDIQVYAVLGLFKFLWLIIGILSMLFFIVSLVGVFFNKFLMPIWDFLGAITMDGLDPFQEKMALVVAMLFVNMFLVLFYIGFIYDEN